MTFLVLFSQPLWLICLPFKYGKGFSAHLGGSINWGNIFKRAIWECLSTLKMHQLGGQEVLLLEISLTLSCIGAPICTHKIYCSNVCNSKAKKKKKKEKVGGKLIDPSVGELMNTSWIPFNKLLITIKKCKINLWVFLCRCSYLHEGIHFCLFFLPALKTVPGPWEAAIRFLSE